MTKFPVGARVTFMMKGRAFCMSEVDIRRVPPGKLCRQSSFPPALSYTGMTVAKVCSDLFRQGKAAFRRLLTSVPFHRGGWRNSPKGCRWH